MKKGLIIFLLFQTVLGFAQMHEGFFQYDIALEAKDTSQQTLQTIAMLRNSKMELYFDENRTRLNFIMGKFSSTAIIVDREKQVTLSLNSSFAGKKAILMKKVEDPQNSNQLVKSTEERAVILGYNCFKVLVTEGTETYDYWVTDEIVVDKKSQVILNKNLPGFPVKFSKIESGVRMTYQLTNVKKSLENKEAIFITDVPVGYELIEP